MRTLVAAVSGRALAAAARRAGSEVVVADLFGDMDTRRLAPWLRLRGNLSEGIERGAVSDLARAVKGRTDGIVYGTGFEPAPEMLQDLARIAPLIGNAPEIVATVKEPYGFAELLGRLGLPHPTVASVPYPGKRWLRKRRGGSGGTHIRLADPASGAAGHAHYYQALAPGNPFSALFVANGRAARTIGFSAQWTSPGREHAFRYGGCAGSVLIPSNLRAQIEEACTTLTAAIGLVGLNSLDMLIAGDTFTVLEINPRPGATLDVFDDDPSLRLWEWHCRSVRGELPPPITGSRPTVRAAAVVYADRARYVPPGIAWEPWIADIPAAGSCIVSGAPVCTVFAAGPGCAIARDLTHRRSEAVLRRLPEPFQQSLEVVP